jgi:hypothetical protein
MNLSSVIDITVSLTFIYLVLSLVASEIQEIFATIFEWRAKHLKESIAHLLGEENSAGELTQKLYSNPLIQCLNQKAKSRAKSTGPSYISAQIFAAALLDLLEEIESDTPTTIERIIINIKTIGLPKGLQDSLISLAKRAQSERQQTEKQIQKLQQEIATWFDKSMERASGVYKRNAKGVATIISLVLAILANVDTIYIVNTLSKDRELRSAIDRVTEQVFISNPDAISCLNISEDKINQANCLTPIKSSIDLVFEDFSPLPIGWNFSKPGKKQLNPLNFTNLIKIIIGWLISAIAISMGAPFWFGLLNKVINIRHTGEKPLDG